MQNQEIKIAITGAAGHIATAFYPLLLTGQVFGNAKLILSLLEIPDKLNEIEGIKMQLEDCAFPTLSQVIVTDDANIALKDADVAVFLGGIQRSPGMERSDFLHRNNEIFQNQGEILNKVAKPTVKVLVVANPSNTNCSTMAEHCPNIPRKNFTSLMMLDHNRCVATLAREAGTHPEQVKQVTIWGNHSLTQYPDVSQAQVNGKPASDQFKEEYLKNALIEQIKQRGGNILQVSKGTSTISGAIAVKDHLHTWFCGTQINDWVSFGVISDGTYHGIPEGVCFSLPVTCKNFEYEVVTTLNVNEFSKQRIQQSLNELLREKDQAH